MNETVLADRFGWSAAARLAAWALLCAVAHGSASAQTARSGGGNANAQLMLQMQQLASERTSLQAELERAKKDLADTRKERDALKAAQQNIERRAQQADLALNRSNAERLSTADELTQTKAKMQELIGKFRETLQKMREVETEAATGKASLATRDQQLKTCIDRNLALYRLNGEVLTRLEKQGFWSRAAESEPFTRLKRIELENLVDDYKSRADDLRVTPETLQSTPVPIAAAPPPAAGPPKGQAAPAEPESPK